MILYKMLHNQQDETHKVVASNFINIFEDVSLKCNFDECQCCITYIHDNSEGT